MTRKSLGLVATVGLATLLCGASPASAQTSPTLGTASTYSVLAGTQVTNTGATTTVSGDVGISPAAGAVGANHPGLTAAMVGGTIHDKDVPAQNAQFDENAAYTQLDLLNGCTFTYSGAFGELAGQSLVPGVYCATQFRLSGGTLTLAGLASDTWVFKSASDLLITGGAAARVVSPSCNVWWRVVSTASFDAGSSLLGNILADTSITLAANASLGGRALARTAEVTLSSNAITACAPNLAPLVPPTVAKAFSPVSITAGGVSRLTITLNNSNAVASILSAAFTDTLPSGVLVAAVPNLITTCAGWTTAGTTATLAAGSTIPASGSCTIGVDVTAAAAGTYLNTTSALQTSTGNAPAATATLVIAAATCPVITLAPPTLPAGQVGVAYSQQITSSGGTGTVVFTVLSGTLPAGLTLTSGGLLAGTPTTAGSSTVVIQATDGNGCPGVITYTIVIAAATCPVITLTPPALPTGQVGVAYSQQITASGGTGTVVFTVLSGTLPAGLTLSSGGLLSGTPTTAASATVVIQATDGSGCPGVITYTIGIVAATCPVITLSPPTLPNGTVGVAWSQTLTGSGGTGPYSFGLTAGTLPPGVTLTQAGLLGLLSGTPTASGTSTFTIRVTDANGCFAERSFTMVVAAGVPTLPQAFVLMLALGLAAVGYVRLRRRARAE
jgi:hypothetical protein